MKKLILSFSVSSVTLAESFEAGERKSEDRGPPKRRGDLREPSESDSEKIEMSDEEN